MPKRNPLSKKRPTFASETNKNRKVMKKNLHGVIIALLTLCSLAITSCDTEIDNTSGVSDSFQSKIANTRWQLSEVFNSNNVWVTPALAAEIDITDLRFGSDNKYEMVIKNFYGNQTVHTFRGHFNVDHKNITFTGDPYSGIIISLGIHSLDNKQMEGVIMLMGDPQAQYSSDGNRVTYTQSQKAFTIRLQRK
jgi:hypothetical protein